MNKIRSVLLWLLLSFFVQNSYAIQECSLDKVVGTKCEIKGSCVALTLTNGSNWAGAGFSDLTPLTQKQTFTCGSNESSITENVPNALRIQFGGRYSAFNPAITSCKNSDINGYNEPSIQNKNEVIYYIKLNEYSLDKFPNGITVNMKSPTGYGDCTFTVEKNQPPQPL